MPLGAWLLSFASPLVIQVLISLGIGLVSYTGFTAVCDLIFQQMQSALAGLPTDTLALVGLSGVMQGVGIILSALAVKAGLNQVTKIQMLK